MPLVPCAKKAVELNTRLDGFGFSSLVEPRFMMYGRLSDGRVRLRTQSCFMLEDSLLELLSTVGEVDHPA